jgi:hypothetical protein
MKNIFAVLLSFLVLLSGQTVFAVTYYSKVATPNLNTLALTDWSETTCGATMADATTAFSGTADIMNICGTGSLAVGAVSVTGAIPATVARINVLSGASLTLTGNVTTTTVLTLDNAGTVTIPAANTIDVGATGVYSGAGKLVSKCTSGAATAWDAAVTWDGCGVAGQMVASAGLVPSADSDVSIGHAVTAPTAATLAAKSITFTAGSLALASKTLTLGGNLTTLAASGITGSPSLTLTSDANHTLTLGAGLTVGTITLNTLTTARTIGVVTSAITATTITGFATCTGGTITTTSIPAANYSCAVAGGGGGTVSAPIFSTKEKPAVFSEEAKH